MGGHQARLLAAAFSPDNRVLAGAARIKRFDYGKWRLEVSYAGTMLMT